MTDIYIEKKLIDIFFTLNEFSNVPFIITDDEGNSLNVSLPNVPFTIPEDKRFFILSFLPNEPEPAGRGENAENRWEGIFQIDIIIPIGAGIAELENKYEWITKLFQRGTSFNEIMIKRTYRATHGAELAFYKTVIRVEFIASLPK